MKYLKRQKCLHILFVIIVVSCFNIPMNAQLSTKDDIHLFQSFFRDATVSSVPYGEGLFNFLDYEHASVFNLGAQGGLRITPEIELNTGLYYQSIDPDGDFESESGIADLPLFGRYIFANESRTKFSGGAFITLPIGSEDIGEGNTNFGFFGAVRHAVSRQVVLTGTLGLDFLEIGDDREASLNLAAGTIIGAADRLNVLVELNIQTEPDYSSLSGGIDYRVSRAGHIRGVLLIGTDDNAPDIGIGGGFLFYFD